MSLDPNTPYGWQPGNLAIAGRQLQCSLRVYRDVDPPLLKVETTGEIAEDETFEAYGERWVVAAIEYMANDLKFAECDPVTP